MRLDSVLVGLLSLTMAAAADVALPVDGVRGAEKRRRANVQRRVKKSMMGSSNKMMGKKSSKSGDSRYDYDDGYYYGSVPTPPQHQPHPYPPPDGYVPFIPEPGKAQKKSKDPREHYYGSRLMQPKSGKGQWSGKGKGKGFTYPPFPSPPPRPTPSPAPNSQPGTSAPTPDMPDEGCLSQVAITITEEAQQTIARNPPRCCVGNPPAAVFITHAEPDDSTFSGFEPFWDAVYSQFLEVADAFGVCFVMTGYDPGAGTRELAQVLEDTIGVASTLQEVPSIMATDPTTNVQLMQAIRSVSSNSLLSSIGVFNSGFNNVVVESIVSGQDRLPYVGYLSDAEYGTEAGRVSRRLLDGTPAVPLCYNARLGIVENIAERCASFYAEVTSNPVNPEEGVACSSQSNPQDLANQIRAIGANIVWSHVDCCNVVYAAVSMVREEGQEVFVGCQDLDTTDGAIDFVTQQPIELEANQAASWALFPVLQAQRGLDGRGNQFFPAPQSLVNTGIYSVILL